MVEAQPQPRIVSNSTEFEFWKVINPVQPNLLSADELFSDGVLLPLNHLNHLNLTNETYTVRSGRVESAELSATSALTSSKHWRDIFRKNGKKSSLPPPCSSGHGVKERRREKMSNTGWAELNINIWPFGRSISAGSCGSRGCAAASRKVSSAPCSRSNSRGESKSRKWASSPSRAGAGVHLGRSSPVWQVRRSAKKDGQEGRRRVPVANFPICSMGYRHRFSCISAGDGMSGGQGVRGNNLFNMRSLFTKKVY